MDVTDRPLTRSRLRELNSAGLTPALSVRKAADESELKAVAQNLFDRADDQTRDEDCSPVKVWKEAEPTVIPMSVIGVPATPLSQMCTTEEEASIDTQSCGNCSLNPTPNNTPADGRVAEASMNVLGQAMQGLPQDTLQFEVPAQDTILSPTFKNSAGFFGKEGKKVAAMPEPKSPLSGSVVKPAESNPLNDALSGYKPATPDMMCWSPAPNPNAVMDMSPLTSPPVLSDRGALLSTHGEDCSDGSSASIDRSPMELQCCIAPSASSNTPEILDAKAARPLLTPVPNFDTHQLEEWMKLPVGDTPSTCNTPCDLKLTPQGYIAQDVESTPLTFVLAESAMQPSVHSDQVPEEVPSPGSHADELSPVPYESAYASDMDSPNPTTTEAQAVTPTMCAAGVMNAAFSPSPSPSIKLGAPGEGDNPATPMPFNLALKNRSVIPETPEAIISKPRAFGKSAGSVFATPEVAQRNGSFNKAAELRAAQKHVPAWNRISRLSERETPLAHNLVQRYWHEDNQPAWAKTPWILLQAICAQNKWDLSVQTDSGGNKMGGVSCSIATVILPGTPDDNTVSGTGRCTGQLESLIMAGAWVLQELQVRHKISGKDVMSAITMAASQQISLQPNYTSMSIKMNPARPPALPKAQKPSQLKPSQLGPQASIPQLAVSKPQPSIAPPSPKKASSTELPTIEPQASIPEPVISKPAAAASVLHSAIEHSQRGPLPCAINTSTAGVIPTNGPQTPTPTPTTGQPPLQLSPLAAHAATPAMHSPATPLMFAFSPVVSDALPNTPLATLSQHGIPVTPEATPNTMYSNAFLGDGRDVVNPDASPIPSPHQGIGVKAPVDMPPMTPEYKPLRMKSKLKASTAGSTPGAVSTVYHPPFKTGTSPVLNDKKATLGATAKPTGMKAIQQCQDEMEDLAKRVGTLSSLTESMNRMTVAPLKGVPMPAGKHTTFDDDGKVAKAKVPIVLRGLPVASGVHISFDSDDEN